MNEKIMPLDQFRRLVQDCPAQQDELLENNAALRAEIEDWRALMIWARQWAAVGVAADRPLMKSDQHYRIWMLKQIDAKLAEPLP